MAHSKDYGVDKLVALASIAAELHSVMAVAWGVSLAAKNAKVISAQAGAKVLGFQPITEFIDEISQLAMDGVNDINHEALRLVKIAVNERRCIDAYRRFDSVRRKDSGAQYISSLAPVLGQVEKNMLAVTREFEASLRNLSELLELMDNNMVSARAIASVSRIVTASSGEYNEKLSVVARDLDNAAIHIKEKLAYSYKHLSNVNMVAST